MSPFFFANYVLNENRLAIFHQPASKFLRLKWENQRTESFIALPTLNLTVVFAGILIIAPVAGLLPSRAFRLVFFNLPNPGTVNSPFRFTSVVASSVKASKKLLTSLFFNPVLSANELTIAVCVIRAIV